MHMTITFTILFPRLEGRKHGWLWCTDVGDEDYVRAVMGSSASTFSPWEVRAEKDETGRHTDKIIEGDNFLGEFQPSLEHASLGGVISGVRLSGVTIEDLLYSTGDILSSHHLISHHSSHHSWGAWEDLAPHASHRQVCLSYQFVWMT